MPRVGSSSWYGGEPLCASTSSSAGVMAGAGIGGREAVVGLEGCVDIGASAAPAGSSRVGGAPAAGPFSFRCARLDSDLSTQCPIASDAAPGGA